MSLIPDRVGAQWINAAQDTLTHDSFRDENTAQSLAVDSTGTLHGVWQRANTGTGWRIFHAQKGTAWTPPDEVGDSSLPSFHPALAVEPATGIPWVAYQASFGSSDEIVVARRAVSVWDRTRLTTNATQDLSPCIAVDAARRAHVAWIGQDASLAWRIMYATNISGAWQVQLLAGSSLGPYGSGAAPFLAVTSTGVAHIFYRGGDYTQYHIHHATNSSPGDSSWSYEIITTPNGNDFTSAAVIDAQEGLHLLASGNDGFGFPPHAYYLMKAPGGSWSTPELANPGGAGSGGSLVIDRFGKGHVTWNEVSGNIITGNLFYATNRTGSWVSSPVQTDGETYNGVLAIDGSDRGHIITFHGATFATQEIIVFHSPGVLTNIRQPPTVQPSGFALYQNYPNPFNPATRIAFDLSHNAYVSLRVFDNLGRQVASLVDGNTRAGKHTVLFDGTNLASGTYVYSLQLNNSSESRRMLLIR